MNTLDRFLTKHKSTRYQVYKATGLAQTTLKTMSNNAIEKWMLKSLFKVAAAVNMKPEEVLKELIEIERRE